MGKKLAHLKKVFSMGQIETERIEADAFVGIKVYGVLPYPYILFFDKWAGKYDVYEGRSLNPYGIDLPHIHDIIKRELDYIACKN